MATKKSFENSSSAMLIVSKSKFKDDVYNRIVQGEELLKEKIQTMDDFEKLKLEYFLWYDYNVELLNPNNSL